MIKLSPININTEYSLLESTIKIDKLIKLAKENNLKELVITDRNNMFGVAEFIFKTKKNNIKPIIGIDLDVEKYRFILIAKNYEGYKELLRLSSLKQQGNAIEINDINSYNLFIIDHPTEGFVAIEKRQPKLNNFFVGSKDSISANSIWFNETKIFTKEENIALDILSSISGKEKKHNLKPINFELDENNAAVMQLKEILDECNIIFPKEKNFLPNFKIPTEEDKLTFLKSLIIKGFKERKIDINKLSKYKERISLELSIISKLGFIDYFLIIWDLINWAKNNKIAIGPGRGSAAGSLISYLLKITDIDPIKFELLFERFLNPERVSMPDIDIDIQDNRRDEVVSYLFNKYGKDNVAMISTFSKIGAKTALRDVGRLLNFPARDVDAISKLINPTYSLEETYNRSVRFRAAINKSKETEELFEKAKLIEGLPRQRGTHAAGIVISNKNLIQKVPITTSIDGHNQTQYSMDFLEEHGLLKIDLLGLKNLTIIQNIEKEIWKNYNRKIDLSKIDLNDNLTNKLLNKGDTNGIFQLESPGMKKTLVEVKVDNFNDLVSIISLFRPGPMEFIPEFIAVKNGEKKIQSIHPIYDKIVKPTKGIIIFQEQIMLIAQKLTGMSFGKADILRRAISKKKINLINSLKEDFINGAIKNNLSKEQANIIYENIEKFANYGFNKSHAVSYGILAYQMAFLKARFPFEFYTAILQSSIGSQKQIKKYVLEAKSRGIKIIAPDINKSEKEVINKDKAIIMPLLIIKGFGSAANDKLLKSRKELGKAKDFFDFVVKAKINNLGESQIQTLIQANALRSFGNIKTLLDSLPSALRYANMILVKEGDTFKVSISDLPKPSLIEQPLDLTYEMTLEEKALGFNINLFPTIGKELEDNLLNIKENNKTTVVALVKLIKKIKDKNDNEMGIITLIDSNKTIEAMAFYDVFKFIDHAKKGIIVKVELVKQNYNGKETYKITKPWEVL